MIRRAKKGYPTKKQGIEADKILQAWLRGIGAEEGPHGFKAREGNGWPIDCPEFYIETTLGRLRVLPASSHGGSYVVYCRWEDVARAVATIGRHGMNEFSGKWNHHNFDGGTETAYFAVPLMLNIAKYLLDETLDKWLGFLEVDPGGYSNRAAKLEGIKDALWARHGKK